MVTGAASGIGKDPAHALASRGARVALLDFDAAAGERAAQELTDSFGTQAATFLACDVSITARLREGFAAAARHLGGLDMVFNNAGIGNEKNWQKMLDINLTAVIEGTYKAAEYMVDNGTLVCRSATPPAYLHPLPPTSFCL